MVAVDTSVICYAPNVPFNAFIETQSPPLEDSKYLIGSYIKFACRPNHEAIDKPTILCQRDGTWTRNQFQCRPTEHEHIENVTCAIPNNPPNNAYIFASSPSRGRNLFAIGDFIQYACMDGFASDERPITICQPNGFFSPQVRMNCIRIAPPTDGETTCIAPGITTSANLVQVSPLQVGNRYYVGDSVIYACKDGFNTNDNTIVQCQTNGVWSSGLPTCSPNDRFSR